MKPSLAVTHFSAFAHCAVLALTSLAPNVHAQAFRDYRCRIERVDHAEPLSGKLLDYQKARYIGKDFTVDRRTGVMSGILTNTYVTRPEVIDFGSDGNSYKVVTTLRKEQGAGRGSNAYLLVVNEYKIGPAKPFIFVENDEIYFGNCIHL